ncbi:hypothetical protein HWV62_38412 [Athelia sp. TMB]|nr:hypothetical protein HWV62_38412 [Athelia sp. TMB]
MPRKKPTSTKQLKAERQLKRAVKRGDAPPPDPLAKKPKRPKKGASYRQRLQGTDGGPSQSAQNAIVSSRKLQSAFIKLPPSFLEDTKRLASALPLPRPIPVEAAVLSSGQTGGEGADRALGGELTCPKRPKWRFDMTKVEVEKNEEGLFKKWIEQMDQIVEEWQKPEEVKKDEGDDTGIKEEDPVPAEPEKMPRSSTFYERNLEVWRQLWRVVEISQIILVLLDSRCPLLHFPPSLAAYLSERRVILVLTKVDISGPVRAAAWTNYLQEHYPGRRIVQVEAYAEKTASAVHQGRAHWEPHLPQTFKERLVDAIRAVHAEMMVPPERIRDDAEKVARWKPPAKREVDWARVANAGGGQVGSAVGGAVVPKLREPDGDADASEMAGDVEPEFLTIGLIGKCLLQSSLLNALFGTHKVRASKTPGKTKHFQTLFWTPDVRLVDCPGLVMPNLVPMEMQVLSGILPISRVSAISACIYYMCQYLPLEQIFKLTHPSLAAPPVEDKRTWRDGTRPASVSAGQAPRWTAMDVLTAYADQKGWVTAKAGRPDVGRAGNAILRAVAESRVKWAFWPPGTDVNAIKSEMDEGNGIWIAHAVEDGESESEDEDEELPSSEASAGHSDIEEQEEDEEDDDAPPVSVGVGRFDALVLDENEDGDESEDDEDE